MSKGGHRHGCYRHAPRDLQEPPALEEPISTVRTIDYRRICAGRKDESGICQIVLGARDWPVRLGVGPLDCRETAERWLARCHNRRAHSPGENPARVRPRPPSAAIPDVGSAAMCSSTRRTPEKFSAATPNLSPSCRGYSRGDTAHQALAFAQGPCTNQLPGGGSVRPLAQRRGKG